MADNNPPTGEIAENPPVNGNGSAAAATSTEEDVKTSTGEGKHYRAEEFVRVKKQQFADRLGRVKEEFAQVDVDDLGKRAANWVRENPVLAVTIAAGAGILIGRGLVSLLRSPQPPPLSVRAGRQARHLAHRAQDYLGDVGDVVGERAADASAFLKRKADLAGAELASKARELSEDLSRRAADAAEAIADSAGHAADSASERAQALSSYARKRVVKGRDVGESLLGSIKGAVAAVVVQRIGDWIRRA